MLQTLKFPSYITWIAHLALVPLFAYEILWSTIPRESMPQDGFEGIFFDNFPMFFMLAYGLIWVLFRKETITELWEMPLKEKARRFPLQFAVLNLQIIPLLVRAYFDFFS